MSCDLTSGRLRGECLVGRAGIKKLYFTKYSDFAALTGVTEVGGEITDLGAVLINLYQFDVGDNVGNFEEVPTVSKDNGTSFITQTVTLTLFNIKPADLDALNKLKKGRWTIWALDFQDKIRMFGRTRGMVATGGSDVSGVAPGDKRGLDLILTATENSFAPFMQDYSTDPFDNYANVAVSITGLGPELVVNGTFALWTEPGSPNDYPTSWTLTGEDADSYLSNNAGRVHYNNIGATNVRIYQSILTSGKHYRVVGDIDVLTGAYIGFTFGGGGTNITSAGPFTFDVAATGAIFLIVGTGTLTGDILNSISVKEIL